LRSARTAGSSINRLEPTTQRAARFDPSHHITALALSWGQPAIRIDCRCSPATRKESEISPTLQTTASTVWTRGSFVVSTPAVRRLPQRDSIATSGSPMAINIWESFGFILSWELAEGFFGVLDILRREFAGFDQSCDNGFHPTAEQAEEVV